MVKFLLNEYWPSLEEMMGMSLTTIMSFLDSVPVSQYILKREHSIDNTTRKYTIIDRSSNDPIMEVSNNYNVCESEEKTLINKYSLLPRGKRTSHNKLIDKIVKDYEQMIHNVEVYSRNIRPMIIKNMMSRECNYKDITTIEEKCLYFTNPYEGHGNNLFRFNSESDEVLVYHTTPRSAYTWRGVRIAFLNSMLFSSDISRTNVSLEDLWDGITVDDLIQRSFKLKAHRTHVLFDE